MESLAEVESRRGNPAAAAEWWRQLAHVDPLNARITVGCMEAMCEAGDRAGALRFAQGYEVLLREELGTEPDANVAAAMMRLRVSPSPAPATSLPSPAVAVLPFVNLTNDRENEYFSDGMTEELSNALARVPGLRVAARTSAFAFKGKDLDAREIAARLGVSALVEGTVRKIGERIRLTAQLIDAADGCHLWSETYERTLEDVFALQEELARAIVAALPMSVNAPRTLVQAPTQTVDAYNLYLQGRYAAQKRTVEGLALAVEYFEQAIEKDREFALAYAGLAECWGLRGFGEFGDLQPVVAMPRAKEAAFEALRLDPRLSQAHCWLGVVHFLYDWDWDRAASELQHALRLKRDNTYALVWYAVLLAQSGQHGESLRRIHQAEAVDPLFTPVRLTVGRCYYWARLYPESLDYFRSMLRAEPGDRLAAMWLARSLACTGRYNEALDQLEQITTTGHQRMTRDALRSLMLAGAGRREEALALCREMQGDLEGGHALYPSTFVATALFRLGAPDEAFEMLEKGVLARSGFMAFLGDPLHDPLRTDPRFGELAGRAGLRVSQHPPK